MSELLKIQHLNTGYGQLKILWDVNVEVLAGERVVVLGSNGAGKTTLLKTIVGLLPAWSGDMVFDGLSIEKARTDIRIRQGISYLSEIGIIPTLTIEDNLRIGGYHKNSIELKKKMSKMYDDFPILKEKKREFGGSLSGGQRKMLAVARALMSDPKLLIMDEPSAGLSPLFVNDVIEIVKKLRSDNMSFMIAEQNIKFLDIADKVFVLDSGRIIFSGTVEELEANDAIRQAYFGITH